MAARHRSSWRIGIRPVEKRTGLPDTVCETARSAHRSAPSTPRNPAARILVSGNPANAAILASAASGERTKSSYRTSSIAVPLRASRCMATFWTFHCTAAVGDEYVHMLLSLGAAGPLTSGRLTSLVHE